MHSMHSLDNTQSVNSGSNLQHQTSSTPVNSNPSEEFWTTFTAPNSGSSTLNSGGREHASGDKEIYVSEEVKFALAFAVERFLRNSDERELPLPTSFTSVERAYVHKMARAVGLKSKSTGYGIHRSLSICKPDLTMLSQKAALFSLTWNSRRAISQLIQNNPVTGKEKVDLQPKTDRTIETGNREERQRGTTGKLMGAVPQVPPARNSPISISLAEVASARRLSVWEKKAEIVRYVSEYPVIIVSGPPGCGKTTQIPQMLLEEWASRGQRCRIICTQPRRLAAHANSERVAAERGETVGQTVGYQIRLESKVSPRTLVTFCTNGVLLRTLYADANFLTGTTHILVDEVHERDRHTDFLLMVLRNVLKTHRHLRVVLLISSFSGPATTVNVSSMSSPHSADTSTGGVLSPYTSSVDIYKAYFDRCPVIQIQPRNFEVCEFFMEDILLMLRNEYWTKEMDMAKQTIQKDAERRKVIEKWVEHSCSALDTSRENLPSGSTGCTNGKELFWSAGEEGDNEDTQGLPLERSNPELAAKVDKLLAEIWYDGGCGVCAGQVGFSTPSFLESENNARKSFPVDSTGDVSKPLQSLIDLILMDRVPADYEHYTTGLTPLMICAARGHIYAVEQLLAIGASPFVRSPVPHQVTRVLAAASVTKSPTDIGNISNSSASFVANQPRLLLGMTASDWATYYHHKEVADMLIAQMKALNQNHCGEKHEGNQLRFDSRRVAGYRAGGSITTENTSSLERDILTVYLTSLPNEDHTDYFLILALLRKIDAAMPEGTILLFLPSYDDINVLREILLDPEVGGLSDTAKHFVYIVHSRMLVADLKKVFVHPPPGIRKIILSTNICESSLTIEDVVYVIDTGREKKKTFDSQTGAIAFRSEWISQSSANQRTSRAGRRSPGFCYRLYSRLRYESMPSRVIPEIQTFPLEELCLQSKLLSPNGYPITDYLALVPESPSFVTTQNSVKLLKEIGALDMFDDITELGYHLCDLPIESRYGKMVLCSVALKCLDPILTIACILSYSEPFTIPGNGLARREAMTARRKFAADTFSDHMVLLRAFQSWQKARGEGWEKSFCQKNFISAATFEIITGIRTQLLGQLRASGFVKARGSGDIRDLNANSENWAVVKAALVAGMYANFVRLDREHLCFVSNMDAKIRFHPTSVLAIMDTGESLPLSSLACDWLLYDEAVVVGRMAQIRCATLVSPITVALLGGQSRMRPEVMRETENAIYDLRAELHQQQLQSKYSNVPSVYDFTGHSYSGVSSQSAGDTSCMTPIGSQGCPTPTGGGPGSTMSSGGGGGTCVSSDSDSEDGMTEDSSRRVPLRIDKLLNFRLDAESAQMVLQLRHKWHALFIRRLRNPGKQCTSQDEAVLRAVVTVLTSEEQTLGLRQPSGVGARPRPMAAELCNQIDCQSSSGNVSSAVTSSSSAALITPLSAFTPVDSSPIREENTICPLSLGEPAPYHSPPLSERSSHSLCHIARYFLIRFVSRPQVELALNSGVCIVSRHTETKVNTAYQEGKTVYLVFLLDTDSCFYGYARVKQPIGAGDRPHDLPDSLEDCGLFAIDWIRRLVLPYSAALSLSNPWTAGSSRSTKLHLSKDGQEVEPSVGDRLLSLLQSNSSSNQTPSSNTPSTPCQLTSSSNSAVVMSSSGATSSVLAVASSVCSGCTSSLSSRWSQPGPPPSGTALVSGPPPPVGLHHHHTLTAAGQPSPTGHHHHHPLPPPPPSLWIARTPASHHGFTAPPHIGPPPPSLPHAYGPPPPPPPPFAGVACYGTPTQSTSVIFPAPPPPPQNVPPSHSGHHPQASHSTAHHLIFRGLAPPPPPGSRIPPHSVLQPPTQSYQQTLSRH